MKHEIMARLRQVINEQLGVQQDRITEEATWAQLGADSLDRLAMSLAVENAFNVYIPHTQGERLHTVGNTVEHLLTLITRSR
jgi:acyl carrier protein